MYQCLLLLLLSHQYSLIPKQLSSAVFNLGVGWVYYEQQFGSYTHCTASCTLNFLFFLKFSLNIVLSHQTLKLLTYWPFASLHQ